MHVHELQHLAFGNHIGGFCQRLHDAHLADFDHHLESPGIQKIAYQHTCRVAKHLVGGRAAPAQRGFIDDIVMQQGGSVNEFHHGGQVQALGAAIAQGARHQQHQGGPKALAAGSNDVLRHLGYQGNVGGKTAGNDGIHGPHVVGDQGKCSSGTGRIGRQREIPTLSLGRL